MSKYNLALEKIDETTIKAHHKIKQNDNCYYLCEYRSDLGFSHQGFQLLQNIKKKVSQQGQKGYHYKKQDMNYVAVTLAQVFKNDATNVSLIPAASSKAKDDPEYDDRIIRILSAMNEYRVNQLKATELDICDCLSTRATRESLHESEQVRDENLLASTIAVDATKLAKASKNLIFFDDMLTTGCTFQASRIALNQQAGIAPSQITGLFIARRIFPPTAEAFSINDF